MPQNNAILYQMQFPQPNAKAIFLFDEIADFVMPICLDTQINIILYFCDKPIGDIVLQFQ